jgi:hypothetical protein
MDTSPLFNFFFTCKSAAVTAAELRLEECKEDVASVKEELAKAKQLVEELDQKLLVSIVQEQDAVAVLTIALDEVLEAEAALGTEPETERAHPVFGSPFLPEAHDECLSAPPPSRPASPMPPLPDGYALRDVSPLDALEMKSDDERLLKYLNIPEKRLRSFLDSDDSWDDTGKPKRSKLVQTLGDIPKSANIDVLRVCLRYRYGPGIFRYKDVPLADGVAGLSAACSEPKDENRDPTVGAVLLTSAATAPSALVDSR